MCMGWCPRRDSNAQEARFKLAVSSVCTTGTRNTVVHRLGFEPREICVLRAARLPIAPAMQGQGGDAWRDRTADGRIDNPVLYR